MKRIPANTDHYSGRSKPQQPKQSPAYSQAKASDGLLGQRSLTQTDALYYLPQATEDRPTSNGDVKPGWLLGDGTKYPCFDSTAKRLNKGGR